MSNKITMETKSQNPKYVTKKRVKPFKKKGKKLTKKEKTEKRRAKREAKLLRIPTELEKEKMLIKQKRKALAKEAKKNRIKRIPPNVFVNKYVEDNREYLCGEKSIKKIYISYVEYMEKGGNRGDIIGEYVFRKKVRESGYCNSCSTSFCKKCVKMRIKAGVK